MKHLQEFKRHLRPGKVYRRADLEQWSTAVDRHLAELVGEGTLEKLAGGLYYAPRESVYGKVPPMDEELVKAFLKNDHYVLLSPNDYNMLGVGTTQLYNTNVVYNYKRHGRFQLGKRVFHFVRKPNVPGKVTKEFLLVDLMNNLRHLAEDQELIIEKVNRKAKEMNPVKLRKLAKEFGTVATKKWAEKEFA